MLNYILDIIYPNLCVSCDAHFSKGETLLCTSCKAQLPLLEYHLLKDNPLLLKFEGRIPIEMAYAYLSFHKTNMAQNLIHQLKYQRQKQIGIELGRWFGYSILDHLRNSGVQTILPVPIHKQKLKKRGFNQSNCIAKGIAEATNIPAQYKILKRKSKTATQTRKSRQERIENVQTVFGIRDQALIKDKHVLLIDDVITTGATMEACGELVLKAGASKISVAALTVAK